MKRSLVMALTIALLAGSILSGCDNKTESPAKQTGTETVKAKPSASPSSVLQTVIATRPPVRVWRDDSSSMNEDDLKAAVPELLTSIQKNSMMFSGLEVLRFARGNVPIWSEKEKKFTWGDAPTVEGFDDSDTSKAPVATKIFAGAKSNYVNRQRARYEEKTDGLFDEYYRRVGTQIEGARNYLLQPPGDIAPCTKFTTLVRRMAQEDLPYNIVLTDGWIDCARLTQLQEDAQMMRGKIVVVILTRHADTQKDEEAYEHRAADMQRIFPTAKIIPVYMAHTVVDELLK